MTARSAGAVVLSVLLVTAGCDSLPTRLGTTPDPVLITSVYAVHGGGVGTDVLDALVAETSGQAVSVDRPLPSSSSKEEERDALDLLMSGEVDLTVVRSGALALRGAASIAVLQTPLLVVSPEHAAAVAADPVAADLMADLADLGLTGLALVPGGVRHPFGYGRARHGADDYRGIGMSTGVANGVDALIRALGARPDTTTDHLRSEQVAAGRLAAVEASLVQTGGVDLPAVVTSNVTLYTKFDVVVLRTDAWEGLSHAQQAVLQRAAVEAGRVAEAARDDEDAALERWCSTPQAASVVATVDELTSIARALVPAIEVATADPQARHLADRVAALGEGTRPPRGRACGSVEIHDTDEDVLVARAGDQAVFDGVWRIRATYQDFIDAGVSVADARANAGVWTLTIRDHVAAVDQPQGPDCAWDFFVNGDRVAVDLQHDGNDACFGLARGAWRRDGDVVWFTWEKERYYDVAIDNAFFAAGMHRIG